MYTLMVICWTLQIKFFDLIEVLDGSYSLVPGQIFKGQLLYFQSNQSFLFWVNLKDTKIEKNTLFLLFQNLCIQEKLP